MNGHRICGGDEIENPRAGTRIFPRYRSDFADAPPRTPSAFDRTCVRSLHPAPSACPWPPTGAPDTLAEGMRCSCFTLARSAIRFFYNNIIYLNLGGGFSVTAYCSKFPVYCSKLAWTNSMSIVQCALVLMLLISIAITSASMFESARGVAPQVNARSKAARTAG